MIIYENDQFSKLIEDSSYENTAFLKGFGLIETMLFENDQIPLWNLHFSRLIKSCSILQFPTLNLSEQELFSHCLLISKKKHLNNRCVIRMQIFLNDKRQLNIVIKTLPFTYLKDIQDNHKTIGISQTIIKAADTYSSLKTSSRFSFEMAIEEAKKNNWYDILLKNQFGRISESTISNLFWIKNEQIYTPPLTEGCIEGVMRTYLLNYPALEIKEAICTEDGLKNADEIFLANSIRGIQSIHQLEKRVLGTEITQKVFSLINTNDF